jgi:hypothetical protein
MDEYAHRVLYCKEGQRVVVNHVLDRQLSPPERFGILAAYLAIMPFHLRHIAVAIPPLIPIQTREEVVQTEVMEDDDPGLAATHLPYGRMKQRVIADVVNIDIATVEFCPGYVLRLITPHLYAAFQPWVPFDLIRPEYDFGPFSKGREYSARVMSDVRRRRR